MNPLDERNWQVGLNRLRSLDDVRVALKAVLDACDALTPEEAIVWMQQTSESLRKTQRTVEACDARAQVLTQRIRDLEDELREIGIFEDDRWELLHAAELAEQRRQARRKQ